MNTNRQWLLAQRPRAWSAKIISPTRNRRSLNPATVRSWLEICIYLLIRLNVAGWRIVSLLPPVGLGEPMRAGRQGVAPCRFYGDLVQTTGGWQDFVVAAPGLGPMGLSKVPDGVTPEMMLSVLGITGLTAYFGLLDLGQPKVGETVLVSGAAGATGSVAGQIARIKGCRVVGIAGGPEKCAWLKDELGRRGYRLQERRRQHRYLSHCPNKLDVTLTTSAEKF